MRRYRTRKRLTRFLKSWWTLTWLTLGVLAVSAAVGADQVKGEASILALCVAMITLARPGMVARVLTGVLGAVGALLVIFQGEAGLFIGGLWLMVGIMIGGSAIIGLMLMAFWEIMRNDRTRSG